MGPATEQPARILTIGLDRLTMRAVRADLPGARVTARRKLPTDVPRCQDIAPHLVLINGAGADPVAQRAAVWRQWGEAVVVTEIHARQPTAQVYRTPTVVESVEVGPGFLAPFLPRTVLQPLPSARPLATLRMIGYLVVLWNLTIGLHLMDLSSAGVALTMAGFAVLVLDLVCRGQRDRRLSHHA